MNELSIEEKARRYDEAIEKFDVILNLNTVKESGTIFVDDVRKILPELCESEDERMMNQLHRWMKEFGGAEEYTEKVYQWLRCLIEKQGENANFRNNIQIGDKVTRNKDGVLVNLSQLNRVAKKQDEQKPTNWLQELEDKLANATPKQRAEWKEKYFKEEPTEWHSEDEQNLNACLGFIPDEFLRRWLKDAVHVKYDKGADKVEPKFHEGDWITNGDYTWKIVEVKPLDYILQSQDGNVVDDTISHVDEHFHSFTIEDTKAGDVLVDGNLPFIFKKIDANKYSYAYCGISVDGGFKIESDGESSEWTWTQDIKPATKEQRNQLEKAMTDAGYTFDFEKKELKKIEQNPAEWTMQDEEELKIVLDTLVKAGQHSSAKWLKNICLIPQNRWKPSDEQMEALDIAIRYGIQLGTWEEDALKSLKEQLKRLMEE